MGDALCRAELIKDDEVGALERVPVADNKFRVGQSLYPEEETVALGRGVRGKGPAQGVGIHDVDGARRKGEAPPDEGCEAV